MHFVFSRSLFCKHHMHALASLPKSLGRMHAHACAASDLRLCRKPACACTPVRCHQVLLAACHAIGCTARCTVPMGRKWFGAMAFGTKVSFLLHNNLHVAQNSKATFQTLFFQTFHQTIVKQSSRCAPPASKAPLPRPELCHCGTRAVHVSLRISSRRGMLLRRAVPPAGGMYTRAA